MRYVHPQRTDDLGLVYIVQTTADPATENWMDVGQEFAEIYDTGDILVDVIYPISGSDEPIFLRLKIERDPSPSN